MRHRQQNSWKKNYLTIMSGQTLSIIGSSAVQFSLIWWLASETSSPLVMALAGLLAFLPQLVLGPFAGVWIDRHSRKAIIIGADLFIGLVATVFALSFHFTDPPYWLGCVVIGVRAVAGVFHTPAMQATVPLLVPAEELVKAGSWGQFLQSGAYLLGPVLGGILYGVLPFPVLLLSDLVGAVAASICVAVVKIPQPERTQDRQHFFQEMRAGLAVFATNKTLLSVTVAIALSMVFFMPLSSFYPLMTSDYFSGSPLDASAVQTAYAIGMMAGAAAIGALKVKDKLAATHIGVMVLAATCVATGLLPPNRLGFWIFVPICFVMGGSANLYSIPYMAYIQETVPGEAQGRAFSLVGSLMSVTMPVGLLVAGPVAQQYGVPLWFLVAGGAMLVVMAASMLRSRRKTPE